MNSKLPDVKTTIFTIMGKLAQENNAINLSQGFPDFATDPNLIDLVSTAMKSGYNQYAPMQGIIGLREQIAIKFNELYKVSYNPDTEITITSGATQAIFTIISTFIHQDDEVIIFKPAYDCYEPAIELNKGKSIFVQLQAPNFAVDWAKVKEQINAKTKMIVINTPHNPSGSVWSKQDMIQLEALVKNTDIIILSDEVYEHIIFDNKPHQSVCKFPYLKERSFIVASFGKTFHTTGWKMGYCSAPSELMHEFRKVHQFNVFCANHPFQIAFAEYLKNSANYNSLNLFYEEKRNFLLNAIRDSRFKFIPSSGTYFQLLDYTDITNEGDIEYAQRLVKENQLACIPISVFNTNNIDHNMLRFCFAKKNETLEKAAEILCKI